MKKEYEIKVEISNVTADEEYYTFNYKVWVNGKLKDKGEINDDYCNGMTPKEWIKELKDNYALQLVMVKVFE